MKLVPLLRLGAALWAGSAVSALAEDTGEWSRKAGEWQISELGPDGAATGTQKICFAKGTIEDFVRGLKPCLDRKVARTGDVTTVDAVCPRGQQQVAIHITLTAHTDDAYRIEVNNTLSGPGIEPTSTQSKGEGKWLGPCAEGEKPIN
jgi:Protein of unknown function (DUF3617)